MLQSDQQEGKEVFAGYAIMWGQPSLNLGGFVRMFERGCFTESLATQEANYLYAHEDNDIYASTDTGTLRLREDDQGLWIEVTPPEWDQKFCARIRNGLVKHQSVGVMDAVDSWSQDTDPVVRHILKATLVEISATAYPAFPQTTLEARMLNSLKTKDTPQKDNHQLELLQMQQQQAILRLQLQTRS